MSGSVVVVGGGISGLMSAWYLRRDGRDVTIVERGPDGDGCSYGNAGLIVPSHFLPLASPGAFADGLRWLWSSHSPFSIRPRLSGDFLGWAVRFARACTEEHVERSVRPLYELNELSHRLYRELAERYPEFDYARHGLAVLCCTEKALSEEGAAVEVARDLGIEARVLNQEEVTTLQNGTAFAGTGAAYYESDARVDPAAVMRRMRSAVSEAGVQFETGTVTGFTTRGGRITEVVTDSRGPIAVESLVLAAGSWTPQLARHLGIRLFVQPGKGYGVSVADPPVDLHVPVILSEEKVAMTPYGDRLRIVGTVETSGFSDRIRASRIRGIFEALPRYFPALRVPRPHEEEIWHGFRSLSANGLPYIGRHPSFSNLTIATGHSMMGMSAGPATGLLVSEIISGRKPSIDIRSFAVDR
jgi:D-amino-acid dehydrogenase